MSTRRKLFLSSVPAAIILLALLCFLYAPGHYMTRIDWPTVKVDDRVVPAEAYIGNPTHSEAEAYILVHVAGTGDFVLNLEEETYRQASGHEFLRLHRTVWMLRPMSQGHWVVPLPFLRVNECRIASSGHLVTISL